MIDIPSTSNRTGIDAATRESIDSAVAAGLAGFRRSDEAPATGYPDPVIRVGQIADLLRCLSDAAGSGTLDGMALESALLLASELLQDTQGLSR